MGARQSMSTLRDSVPSHFHANPLVSPNPRLPLAAISYELQSTSSSSDFIQDDDSEHGSSVKQAKPRVKNISTKTGNTVRGKNLTWSVIEESVDTRKFESLFSDKAKYRFIRKNVTQTSGVRSSM